MNKKSSNRLYRALHRLDCISGVVTHSYEKKHLCPQFAIMYRHTSHRREQLMSAITKVFGSGWEEE